MTTYVFPIDRFIEYLQRTKEDGFSHVVLGFGLHGGAYAPTKKLPFYRVPTVVHKAAFKSDALANVVGGERVPSCLIFIPDELSDSLAEIGGEHEVKIEEK
jgi:hypothetical protein